MEIIIAFIAGVIFGAGLFFWLVMSTEPYDPAKHNHL